MARFVTANGLRVAYEQWGTSGPLALLVHGFPDTPTTWRHLGPTLADAGFVVVAPWTRGYAPTAIPRDADYSVDTRAADLNRLHDVVGGRGDAVLIGHDWGANAAYAAAAAAPERWSRVVTMAVPPEPVLHGMQRRAADLGRAWYMLAAQLPISRALASRDVAPLLRLWSRWSPTFVPSAEDRAALRASLQHPDNVAAALSYYRAHVDEALLNRFPRADGPVPSVPTLYLHGARDRCLRPSYADEAGPVLRAGDPTSRVHLVAGAGHFLHLERPDEVGDLVRAWVTTA